MFETATLSNGPSTKRVWATVMGFTGQALLIGCALLAPLISPQTLGRAFLVTTLAPPALLLRHLRPVRRSCRGRTMRWPRRSSNTS